MAKHIKTLEPKPLVQEKPSKPTKTGLTKDDPEYYRKIGLISASKRNMTSAQFSEMARKSHAPESKRHG